MKLDIKTHRIVQKKISLSKKSRRIEENCLKKDQYIFQNFYETSLETVRYKFIFNL